MQGLHPHPGPAQEAGARRRIVGKTRDVNNMTARRRITGKTKQNVERQQVARDRELREDQEEELEEVGATADHAWPRLEAQISDDEMVPELTGCSSDDGEDSMDDCSSDSSMDESDEDSVMPKLWAKKVRRGRGRGGDDN